MKSESYEQLLAKRRDRVIATILGIKERDCDPFLTAEASAKLRKVVLDQINEFYDLAADLIRSTGDQPAVVVNEHYVQRMLQEIHEVVVGNG